MMTLIKIEYKKIWNKITITATVAMCIIISLHTFIYLNLQWRTIDENNQIISGLKSYRALKTASEDLEGFMDDNYIQKLKSMYDASFDKEYLEEHRGYLGTGGMTKYAASNYFINFAYYGPYMSNGNDKMGLDYEFLSSEKFFYDKYKEAVEELLLTENEWNGLYPYSEEQITVLKQKIDGLETPFYVGYHQGLANIRNWYFLEYPIFFVVIAFILAAMFAKDSPSGLNELTLSSKNGRRKDMNARWIAGNLLAVTVYLIFIALLVLEHGSIASLHGWNVSAQIFWFSCLYNISIGTVLLILFACGLLGVLVMANLVMLLSIKLKNTKITTIAAVLIVWILERQSKTYNQVKLFNPIKFGSDSLIKEYFFVGNIAIPYYAIVILLVVLYIAFFYLLMRRSHKKYYLN